jgi:hypothetical protein
VTPDEVFMVSTGHDQTWWVVCLRGPGLVAEEPMPHGEFDSMELKKLTSRSLPGEDRDLDQRSPPARRMMRSL